MAEEDFFATGAASTPAGRSDTKHKVATKADANKNFLGAILKENRYLKI
jgi:hypothetical protein